MPKWCTQLGLGASNLFVGASYGFQTNYLVQTLAGVWYQIGYGNSALKPVLFTKSTDNGLTWSLPKLISSGSNDHQYLAVWYDRWSGISGDLIHVAYTDVTTDDTRYRSIDTANSDTLSTETTIFAGASSVSGGDLSIVRATGGNLYVHTVIDAGVEGGFYRSTDVGATWGARTVNEAIATTDQIILLPGWNTDTQDVMAVFWDASANEVSRQMHDDSANTWSETSISLSMFENTGTAPQFAAAADVTNTRNVLIAWSNVDLLNSDLRCWTLTPSAITAKTDLVTDSTDDQGMCMLSIRAGGSEWWAFYCGKADGSETYPTAINIYYKRSYDGGTTWSSETQFTSEGVREINGLIGAPVFYTYPMLRELQYLTVGTTHQSRIHFLAGIPRAQVILGV